MRLVIIADDFTGALDTGVRLAKDGVKTVVTSQPDDKPEDFEVVAYNLDFRHCGVDEAYDKVYGVMAAWREENVRFYLKTDSALRGRLSAAFAAATDAARVPAVFVPAFPQAGRTTKNGFHFIDGVLLERSGFAADPRNPAIRSYIPDILREDMPLDVELIPENGLTSWEYRRDKIRVCLFDCTDTAGLQKIAAVVKEQEALTLTAGCAGFISVFPEIMELRSECLQKPLMGPPLLVVSGSVNERSFTQISTAIETGYPFLHLSPELILSQNKKQQDELLNRAVSLLRDGHTVIAAVGKSPEDRRRMDARAQSLGVSSEALHRKILEAITGFTTCVMREAPSALFMFGGDTGFDLLKSFGMPRVEPLCEVEPGVPVSAVCVGGREITLLTKSGGLGSPDVVARAEKFLAGYAE